MPGLGKSGTVRTRRLSGSQLMGSIFEGFTFIAFVDMLGSTRLLQSEMAPGLRPRWDRDHVVQFYPRGFRVSLWSRQSADAQGLLVRLQRPLRRDRSLCCAPSPAVPAPQPRDARTSGSP